MKAFLLIASLALGSSAQASGPYFDLNLTKISDIKDIYFSLHKACDNADCGGVKLTVPTAAKVSVSIQGDVSCAIQHSASTQFEGGDSYLISTESTLNSGAACEVVVTKDKKILSRIQLVNERDGVGAGGASVGN